MMVTKTSFTDLLIIGGGPAGLMAACWAAEYGVSVRIIDDKPARVVTGHADNLTCRTMEIFDSFNIAQQFQNEAIADMQYRSWAPDETGKLKRVQSLVVQTAGISRFQACILSQGRIEKHLCDLIDRRGGISVERDVKTIDLKVDEPATAEQTHLVQVKVQHRKTFPDIQHTDGVNGEHGTSSVNNHETHSEVIRAKYVIGADGAHSWTRHQLGLELKGDSTAHVWGVLDIVPLTDFPDIRQTCLIRSEHGTIHSVPRERKMIRLYIQLDEVIPIGQRFDRSKVNPKMLFSTAQKIFAPFKLDYVHLDWWTVYQIGQRVADRFAVSERVFLVGDAIHTHSPKIGQGMNVSFQDSYNLGWKVCSVIKGLLKPEVLKTYELERRPIALQLIRVDQETVEYYAARDKGAVGEDLQTFRNRLYSFLSGVAVDYGSSELVLKTHIDSAQNNNTDLAIAQKKLASCISVGQRLPSRIVINHADMRPTQVASRLVSDGRWRLIVFAGDLQQPGQMARIQNLGRALAAPSSFFRQNLDPVLASGCLFAIITIISNPRDTTRLLDLPDVFHPWSDETGWDYDTLFSDQPDVNGVFADAYGGYGVDRKHGCLVICRPDQHVAYVGELDDMTTLTAFCSRIFIQPKLSSGKINGHVAAAVTSGI